VGYLNTFSPTIHISIMSAVFLRVAARGSMARAAARPAPLMARSTAALFSTSMPRRSDPHGEETFEEFTAR
jgi:hypothetical protein